MQPPSNTNAPRIEAEIMARVLVMLKSEEAPSRNGAFQDFAGPQGQRVFKLFRIYQALVEEMTEAVRRPHMAVNARRRQGALELEVVNPKVAYRRLCPIPTELTAFFVERLRELGVALEGEAPPDRIDAPAHEQG
jgi:hypothetical protein